MALTRTFCDTHLLTRVCLEIGAEEIFLEWEKPNALENIRQS